VGGLYLREVEPLHTEVGSGKADILRARLDDGRRVVVKDFALKPLFWQPWGRILVRRERQILERLSDVPAVPHVVPCESQVALVVEELPGKPLFRLPAEEFDSSYLDELRRILDEIHRRGIVHNDLRARDNTLIDLPSGRLFVLDWAGGVRLRPGSWMHRLCFEKLRQVDLSALIKWRATLAPHTLTASDHEFLQRYRVWRYLWPFNRKGLSRKRSGG
jgi:serine/threonine protein kinase